MTLMSQIIRTLGQAQVPGYSVYSCAGTAPGDPDLPDLVVTLAPAGADDEPIDVDDVADLLLTAPLPLAWVKPAGQPGVLHLRSAA